jgi:phenylacetate-CoA ligase
MKHWLSHLGKNNLITSLEIRHINNLYNLSDDELISAYEKRFLELFRHAIKNSRFYKKLYHKNGIGINDIRHLEDIIKLPVFDREMLKDHIDDNFIGWSKLKVKGYTSGTTGTPLTLYRTYQDIAKEQAYIRHYRGQKGWKLGEPLLSVRGMLGKSTDYEYNKSSNILYIPSPNINASTIEMYYRIIKDFAPKAIEAYPSYLHKLCVELEKKNLDLKIQLSFTSSETLYSWQRIKAEQFLNTKVFDWYGVAERSILLANDDAGHYQPLRLYGISEFKKDHVITTGLINHHFPLIRYKVNDTIQVRDQDLIKNIIRPEILKIEGRASENIDLKDGSVVGCLDHTFKGIPHLEMAQIHQYDVNKPIIIKLVVDSEFSKTEEEQLRKNWIRMVGNEMELVFVYCLHEDLIQVPGKKFQLIIKKNPEKAI